MSEQPGPEVDTSPTEPEWVRRKRLAAVFGDVLPDETSDDRAPASKRGEGLGDDWYHEQVPPHHG